MRILAVAICVCMCTAFGQQPPRTRAEQIEQARQGRAANLEPDKPAKADRFLLWFQHKKVIERITLGYEGFRARFGNLISGSGFTFGGEYFRQDLRNNSMNFAASAQISTQNYQRYEGDWGMPTLTDSRLFVATRGLYFNYPSVNYDGPGPDSRGHRSAVRLGTYRAQHLHIRFLHAGVDAYALPETAVVVKSRDLKVAWSVFDNNTGSRTPVKGASDFAVPAAGDGYLVADISQAGDSRRTLNVYLRRQGGGVQVVGVGRHW